MFLRSLIIEYEPSNTNTLFKKAKVALVLYDIRKAISDLKEVAQIELNNYEIAKELVRIESESAQVDISYRELKGSGEEGSHVDESPYVES